MQRFLLSFYFLIPYKLILWDVYEYQRIHFCGLKQWTLNLNKYSVLHQIARNSPEELYVDHLLQFSYVCQKTAGLSFSFCSWALWDNNLTNV